MLWRNSLFALNRLVFICLSAFLVGGPLALQASAAEDCSSKAPKIIRIGVSTYEKVEDTYDKYMNFFASLLMARFVQPLGIAIK